MGANRPVLTPIEGTLIRLSEGKKDKEYMSLVGSLLYAAMVSRPDIAYAVQVLGRHLQASGAGHWVAAKMVLRYLQGTKELTLNYTLNNDDVFRLVGYSDADWGSDLDSR